MAKKLLCTQGCGKPFGSDNAWKKRHEEKCRGEKEKDEPTARPTFKPANHDPEEEPEKPKASEVAEEITLPKKPKTAAPMGAMKAAIDELMEKRKAHLIEVQKIDSLVAQLEALN